MTGRHLCGVDEFEASPSGNAAWGYNQVGPFTPSCFVGGDGGLFKCVVRELVTLTLS